ncbi:hypothetical protein [Actinokineospora globicatena]|uniref:hypothetical protein n=1 Tax=Actinokineospora globicatena TaxID=103729 RepID=UPI0020A31BC3|nr:hypothetical protein [Actinokineospora globicatena]MCP2302959.1 hypothetical protein [Actinokineospora globicatena]GLW78652.1 hypothetical protein Aglo01_31340 [Actinokineospora globicatena]GLW84680.1 hypothetical protein Aglo02_23200 [Actinokineospora globicatena]
MTTLTALARAHAVESGCAQPITTVRHVHVADRPFACVPLALAGEANAPLAALVGDERERPRLLVVHQPRDRDQRFGFAHRMGQLFQGYIARFPSVVQERVHESTRPVDGPQLWVPNPRSTAFLKLFGRSTRYRSVDGPYPVEETVPRLGRWLTQFVHEAEYPGQSMLLEATTVLTQHWATGQSAVEDAHLPALMAWLLTPDGMNGRAAALAAEDPVTHPPAGPATDPTFDREVLAPAMAAYDAASNPVARRTAKERLESALRGQLAPTWDLVWQAIGLMRQLPPGERVVKRWVRDVRSNQTFYLRLNDGSPPQPKRDGAVAAARRLSRLERTQANYEAQRAFDDPLVMAEHRLAGNAFVGTVVEVEVDRFTGKARRPLIKVRTDDPVSLVSGTVLDPRRERQKAEILEVEQDEDALIISLELAGGMGNKTKEPPPPRSLPTEGEEVCYSALSDEFKRDGDFPSLDETPWTHGGPPVPVRVTNEDVQEDWS